MTKRILALLLAIAMITTVFAGCKKEPTNNEDNVSVIYETEYEYVKGDGSTNSNEDGTTNGGTTSGGKNNSGNKDNTSNNKAPTIAQNSNTNKTGFPIVKKQETISVLTQFTAGLGDIANSQFTKDYEKMTNMKIKWNLTPQSEINSAVALAFQSGNLPDIITGTIIDHDDMLQYSQEGTFVEITKDLLKEWAPNIYATYNENPEAWKKTVTSDGKMYALAGFSKDWNYAQHYLWVRTSWLNKLGISKPKTMDQFYEMLVAFKNSDPNGNGQQDEIPYATWSSTGFLFNPWGFTSAISVSKSGKVTNMYNTSNMKNCVSYWAKIYKEGLVDKGTINNYTGGATTQLKSLLKGGKVGCFFMGYPDEDLGILKEYEILEYPTAGNNGDFPSVAINTNPVTDRGRIIITKACKNVTAAIRWVDYLYSNDGYMLRRYGSVGDYYNKSSDTTYTLTGNAFPKDPGPSWALMAKDYLSNAKFTNKTPTYVDTQRAKIDSWCESTLKTNGQKLMPETWKNKAEINAEKLYTSYWSEVQGMYWQFIQGKKNMGSDWTTLVNEMKNKGMDKYISELQKYYDRCN